MCIVSECAVCIWRESSGPSPSSKQNWLRTEVLPTQYTQYTSIAMRTKSKLKKIPVRATLAPHTNLFLRFALNGCNNLVQVNFLHHKENSIFRFNVMLCSASPEYLMEWKYVFFSLFLSLPPWNLSFIHFPQKMLIDFLFLWHRHRSSAMM